MTIDRLNKPTTAMAPLAKLLVWFEFWRRRHDIVRMAKRRGDYRLFLVVEKLITKYVRDNGGDVRALLTPDLVVALDPRRNWIGQRSQMPISKSQYKIDFLFAVLISEIKDVKEVMPFDDGSSIPKVVNSFVIAAISVFVLDHMIEMVGYPYPYLRLVADWVGH